MVITVSSNEPRKVGISMVAWNLVFGIARVTRNLWIKPALEVVDVVASAFEDKEEKKVEDVKPEE